MQENLTVIQQMLTEKIGLNHESLTVDAWKKIVQRGMDKSGVTDVVRYVELLKKSPESLQQLIEEVVVPETWFFRDAGSYDFLAHYIKDLYLHQKHHTFYRVLSLPCSSGEEPYSIAMALDHVGIPSQSYEVHGIDISREALKKADKGIYGKNSFRGNVNKYQQEYFEQTKDGYQIDAKIRTKAFFSYGNIMDTRLSLNVVPYDVVFCRNLFIYLVDKAQHRIFTVLEQLLKPSGILIVAPAEIELVRKYGYEQVKFPKCFAFRKTDRTPKLIQQRKKLLAGEVVEMERVVEEQPVRVEVQKPVEVTEAEVASLAKQHADEGEFDEAEKICLAYIENKGVNPTIYFLLGLIQHAQANENRAEDFFLKTIYLDPKHYEALIYLALLSEKKGNPHKAGLYRRRAEKEFAKNEELGGKYE